MEDPNLRLRQSGTLDIEYIKSPPGLLKVSEIVSIHHFNIFLCFKFLWRWCGRVTMVVDSIIYVVTKAK